MEYLNCVCVCVRVCVCVCVHRCMHEEFWYLSLSTTLDNAWTCWEKERKSDGGKSVYIHTHTERARILTAHIFCHTTQLLPSNVYFCSLNFHPSWEVIVISRNQVHTSTTHIFCHRTSDIPCVLVKKRAPKKLCNWSWYIPHAELNPTHIRSPHYCNHMGIWQEIGSKNRSRHHDISTWQCDVLQHNTWCDVSQGCVLNDSHDPKTATLHTLCIDNEHMTHFLLWEFMDHLQSRFLLLGRWSRVSLCVCTKASHWLSCWTNRTSRSLAASYKAE